MSNPKISVIIPVYNDAKGLRITLNSIISQDVGVDYEIIPVDNNSTDETWGTIVAFEMIHPDIVTAASEERQGSYAARNKGVEKAEGEIIVFIDADMQVDSHWLNKIHSHFEYGEADYLGYQVDVVSEKGTLWGWYDEHLALPTEFYFERKNFTPTCALAVRSEVFERLGTFIDWLESGGDKEFGIRCWNDDQTNCKFANEIEVYHPARENFSEQYQKAMRVGRGLGDLRLLGIDDEDESNIPLPDFTLPPDPRTVWHQMGCGKVSHFIPLYLMDCLISYIQVLSGGIHTIKRIMCDLEHGEVKIDDH